jgi:hypothetical protein
MGFNIESDFQDEVDRYRWSLNPRPLMLRSGAAPFIALKPFNSRALRRVSKHGHWLDLACALRRAPQAGHARLR